MKKPKIYLVGGIEAESDLGAGWREVLTPKLQELGFDTLDPCLFEKDQLAGLQTKRLPETIETEDGETITPTHWHQLKFAKAGTAAAKRFQHYMQRIVRYDINIVRNKADLIVCNWTQGTARGAGSHAEITQAFLSGVPVYTRVEPGLEYPGWLKGCTTATFRNWEDLLAVLRDEE